MPMIVTERAVPSLTPMLESDSEPGCGVIGVCVVVIEAVDDTMGETADAIMDENIDFEDVKDKETMSTFDVIEEAEEPVRSSCSGAGPPKVSSVGSEQSRLPDP